MIKVDVVSGFLGAGKTTLIKKLLKAYKDEKVVLIENEFGEIGIDGDIIERDGFDVFEISSGCICCIMKKDFCEILGRVIKEYSPDRLIVEPTGISILSEIIEVFNRADIAEKCFINSLVTVIDCINYLDQCDVFGEFFEDQIINAHTLLLSKSQFAEEDKIHEIIESLRNMNASAEIITAPWDKLDREKCRNLLDGMKDERAEILHYTDYKPCSEHEFSTIGIETSARFTRGQIEDILNSFSSGDYGEVLRGKGFLRGISEYLEFSYTKGQLSIAENPQKMSGKLCLIGRNMDEEGIRVLFKPKGGGIFNWLKF